MVSACHNILHIRKWTYTSAQPAWGGGKIPKTLEKIIFIFAFYNSYFEILLQQNVFVIDFPSINKHIFTQKMY